MRAADLQRSQAVLDSLVLEVLKAKSLLVEVAPEIVFAELLGKAAAGRPPLFDAMLTTTGTIDYTAMGRATVEMLENLGQAGKIAPTAPAFRDSVIGTFAAAEAAKHALALLGQLARDIMAIPGLVAAMDEAAKNEQGQGG